MEMNSINRLELRIEILQDRKAVEQATTRELCKHSIGIDRRAQFEYERISIEQVKQIVERIADLKFQKQYLLDEESASQLEPAKSGCRDPQC